MYFSSNQLKAYVIITMIAFILLSQSFIDILTQAPVISQLKKNEAIISVIDSNSSESGPYVSKSFFFFFCL